jgi:flagellin
MTTINTNVASMIAQQNLAKASNQMNTSLQRLSTGLQINSGADNPAGLIASQSLQSQMTALNSAITNATQANNMLGTAEGALSQDNSLLLTIQGMVDTAASTGGMTSSQTAANQLQIDQAIQSINRISSTTQFNGTNLLDGTLGYNTTGVTAADITPSSINVSQAVFNGANSTVNYNVNGATAKQAELQITTANRALITAGTITIKGNLGSATVSLGAAPTQAALIAAVNGVTAQTGVAAAADGTTATTTDFTSTDATGATALYGSSEAITITPGAAQVFTTSDANGGANPASSIGKDATVTVNGTSQGVSVNGLNVSVSQTGLNMTFSLASTASVNAAGTFKIMQGGAKFQIGGEINTANQVAVGLSNAASSNLGDSVNGFLNTLQSGGTNALSTGNFSTAANIIASAINQVSTLRGQIGAIQSDTLAPQIASLNTTLDNITSANSTIVDTNYATETASMTKAQILQQAGTSVLAAANANPQLVLSLLKNI